MLEQNEVNKNVIENSDDIDNKSIAKNEKIIGADLNKKGSTYENSNVDETRKPNFIDTFKANLVDLIIIGGISAVGVYVADAMLKIAGYTINQKFQMSFIIFMVIMVFYTSIMENGKSSATIGQKVAKLIITKR